MCAARGVTRADVLCALVRAFIEGQPQPVPAPALEAEREAPGRGTLAARIERAIRLVMQKKRRCTVRELRAYTSIKSLKVGDWDKVLKALVSAGELRVAEEPGARGQTRKVVTWLDGAVL
jgi:hypothetical protein